MNYIVKKDFYISRLGASFNDNLFDSERFNTLTELLAFLNTGDYENEQIHIRQVNHSFLAFVPYYVQSNDKLTTTKANAKIFTDLNSCKNYMTRHKITAYDITPLT